MWPPVLGLATFFAAVVAVIAYQCPGGGLCLQRLISQIPDFFTDIFELAQSRAGLTSEVRPWNILYHLGGNSPWIPRISHIADPLEVPPGCRVDQVHMLSRHAERYPTVKAGIRMLELYQRLVHLNVTFEGDMSFINTWNFFMPDPATRLETLIPTGPFAGTLEAFNTGTKIRTRYEALVARALESGQTRLWASDSPRVAETARYFASGLYGLNWTSVAELNIIPEISTLGADTLTPGDTCLAYRSDPIGHDLGPTKLLEWQSVYLPPIAERLRTIAPDVTFTIHELYTMQEICGFETLARGYSPWCDLFTQDEWRDFEYARDLLHFYRAGAGNKYGPTMGWLFLNATTNLLLAGPEKAGPVFLSFAHDGDIVPFLAALDLLPQLRKLPADQQLKNRTWRTSEVVPMGGRVILERIACPVAGGCWDNGPWYPNHVYCEEDKDMHFVRINVNDGIVRLPGCADGPGGSCELGKFKEHVERRGRDGEDFRELCGLDKDAPERITFLRQPSRKPKEEKRS